MTFLALLPVILSAVILAAHFLRSGHAALTLVCLLAPFLLLFRRPWAAHAIRVGLIAGALEWVRTLIHLAGARQAAGEPVARLVIILGSVIVLAIASVLVFRTVRLRRRYALTPGVPGGGDAGPRPFPL